MSDNSVGLSTRAMKFVRLVAAGEHSVTECYRLAGYANCSSNAAKAAKLHAEAIAAERSRLGIVVEPAEANPEVDDAEKAQLISDLRRVYSLSIERGETGPAAKALRGIERLLRQPGRGGRPSAKPAPAAKPEPQANYFDHLSGAQLFELAYSLADDPDEERAEYEREVLRWAPYEKERQKSLNNEPNNWANVGFPGAKPRMLEDGTKIIDFAEPAKDLKSTASPIALEAGEVVERL